LKIHLATWLEDSQGVTLTKANYINRLMSYFFISQGKFNIREYVKTGVIKKKGKKKQHENK